MKNAMETTLRWVICFSVICLIVYLVKKLVDNSAGSSGTWQEHHQSLHRLGLQTLLGDSGEGYGFKF